MVADAAASCGGCPVYSDVQGNPTEANVSGGVAAFKAHGCDGVIAFGGGSAMDAAKCVALMVGQDRPLFDFEDREDWCDRVDPAGMVPCVAVPTTSGTGSEVGRASVITRAGQESEIPNFKGSYLGHFPLVSADFWTSDHLSERSRSVDAFSGTRARGTLTLKRC